METIRKCRDHIREVNQLDCFAQLEVGCSWSNETQIRRERSLEQDWVSRQVADSTSQIFQAHLSNVNPADLDKPRFDVIEPCDQSSQGALAGAVLPDNGNLFAGSNPKRRNMKCARLAFVAEFNGHEFQ